MLQYSSPIAASDAVWVPIVTVAVLAERSVCVGGGQEEWKEEVGRGTGESVRVRVRVRQMMIAKP